MTEVETPPASEEDAQMQQILEMPEPEFRAIVVNTLQQFQQYLSVFRADITELQEQMKTFDARSERNAADIHAVRTSRDA